MIFAATAVSIAYQSNELQLWDWFWLVSMAKHKPQLWHMQIYYTRSRYVEFYSIKKTLQNFTATTDLKVGSTHTDDIRDS